jgi:hypothetical protein
MTDGKEVRLLAARAPLSVAALLACSACADRDPNVVVAGRPSFLPTTCDGEGVRDAAGSEGALDRGRVTILDTDPALANAGDNRWHVLVEDARDAPIVGALVSLTAFMPIHGHASPKVALSTDEGDGSYRLSPVTLSMPGVWLVDVTVSSGTAAGRATFSICVGP